MDRKENREQQSGLPESERESANSGGGKPTGVFGRPLRAEIRNSFSLNFP
jgi:hypothetical protein